MQVLEIAVRQPLILRVNGKEYRVEYPLTAIVVLEESLGRPMKSLPDWLRMEASELPVVLARGLERNHTEDAKDVADAICDGLETEAIDTVIDGICRSVFPNAMARLEAKLEQMRDEAIA